MTQSIGNPWERYQQQSKGPWLKYQQQEVRSEAVEAPELEPIESVKSNGVPITSARQPFPVFDLPPEAQKSLRQQAEGIRAGVPPVGRAVLGAGKITKRALDQFYNFAIASVVDRARTLPSIVTDKFKSLLESSSSSPHGVGFSFLESQLTPPSIGPGAHEEKLAEIGSVRIPVSEAGTLTEKVTDVSAGVASFVAHLLLLRKISPSVVAKMNPVARTAVLFETQSLATGGKPGEGAIAGAAFGGIGMIPLKSLAGVAVKTPLESGTLAGLTALGGGDETDILISAFIPVGIKVPGVFKTAFARRWKEAKTPEAKAELVKDLSEVVKEREQGKEPSEQKVEKRLIAFDKVQEVKEREVRAEKLKTERQLKPLEEVGIRKEPLVVKPTKEPTRAKEKAIVKPEVSKFEPSKAKSQVITVNFGTPKAFPTETAGRSPILKDGKPVGQVLWQRSTDGKTLKIINIETAKPGTLGLTGVRNIFDQFKKRFPGLEVLQGKRVTGARVGERRDEVVTKLIRLQKQRPRSLSFTEFEKALADKKIPIASDAKSAKPRDQYDFRLEEGTVVVPKGVRPKETNITSLTTAEQAAGTARQFQVESQAPVRLSELEQREQSEAIQRGLDKLTDVEREVVRDTFGVRGEETGNDTRIAERLKITEEEVVKARDSALNKLQKSIPRPSGRRGHAAFISETGFEITELVGSVGRITVRTGRAIPEFLSRNIRRATGRMRKLGEHGKRIADDIDDITFKSQKRYNNDELDIRKAFKGMSLQSRENAAKLRNERITLKEVPVGNRKRVAQAANDLLEIFDRALHAWAAAGGKRLVKGKLRAPTGRGKAFPQVLNKYGRESIDALQADKLAPKTIEEINSMIEKGIYKDYETAVRRIKVFRDRVLRGVNGYLERTRIELPEEWVEWDPLKVAPMLLRRNWLVVHGTEKWGFRSAGSQFPFPKAEVSIREIEKTHPDDAMRVREFIQASFGVKFTATQRSREVAENIRGAQFITKIALSPLTIARNMIDRYAKGLTIAPLSVNVRATLKYPPFLNVWIKSARRIEEDMFRAGAVFGHGSIAEGVEPGRIVTAAIGRPFSISEQGNQTYLALVSSMRMQRDIKRYFQDQGTDNRLGRLLQSLVSLADESPPSVRRRLKNHKLLDLSNKDLVKILESGKIAPVELHAALHRASRDLTFPVIMSTKRMWWDNHPWVRVMAQFKTWPAEQVGFIWKSTIQEAAKGNVLPGMRFIAAVVIAGEIYNIMRDALYGKDEALTTKLRSGQKLSRGEIARVLVSDAIDGGLIGMIADMTWGLTNWLFGPTGATLKDVGHAMQDSVQRPNLTGQAIKEFMTKQLPLTRQVKGTYNLIQNQNDETIKSLRQYQEWRNRAFEWKIAQEKVTIADHMREPVLGFLRGRKSFRRGKDTLAYELAADQITNGDVQAASEYLEIVLRDIKPKDRLNKVEGIRGSMRANAPLGPVKASDMGLFLNQFTPQEQFNAQLLNLQWLQRYEQALALARIKNPPRIIE